MSGKRDPSKNSSYYRKDELITMLDEAINNGLTLYRQTFLNYLRKLTDTKENPTETIAEYLLPLLSGDDSDRSILGVKRITRVKCYNMIHENKSNGEGSNRKEEWTAIRLVRDGFSSPDFGEMIAYQVPLKNIQADIGVGKIDVISFDIKSNKFYIHELKVKPKKSTSEESLLRAVLEIYSYFLTVAKEKLLREFECGAATLVPSVLLHVGCRAYNEYREADKNKNVIKLMKKLGVVFNQYEESNNE
ncbi:MAG: hypothetical protein WBI82_00020 [Sphaerochaeta sp.]